MTTAATAATAELAKMPKRIPVACNEDTVILLATTRLHQIVVKTGKNATYKRPLQIGPILVTTDGWLVQKECMANSKTKRMKLDAARRRCFRYFSLRENVMFSF